MFGRREREEIAGIRAEVEALQSRLSADLTTLDPGDDKLCRQALADAGERATAAGSLTGTAKTATEMLVALRIVVEGLHATQIVREGKACHPDPTSLRSTLPVRCRSQHR